MSKTAACLTIAICGIPLTLLAQSGSPAPQATFRAGVDVVRLDVSVLDRNRRPIRALTADDFTVLEDGKPQPIVAFSAIEIAPTEAPPAPWMRDVGSDVATNELDTRRIVVIVMDDGMTEADPGTAKRGKQIARGVIDRLGPNDLAAVVFTFMGRSQNFTTDHRRLIAAAETFVPRNSVAAHPMTAAAPPKGAMTAGGMGVPLGCKYRGRRGCLTDTLKQVAIALEDTPPGRKTIVLVSSGVPYDFSMENLEAGEDIDDLRQTFQNLQQGNVNIYPFDPTGLTAAGIIAARLDSLRVFADSTGGRAVLATNTPWDQVDQVFQENGSYYLLGFQSTNDKKDGRFRRIAVKVNRSDVDVRTRSGYYAEKTQRARSSASTSSGQAKKPAPVTPLDRALASGLPTGALPLEVSVAPFAMPGRKQADVAIVVGTRRPVSSQQTTETIELFATAFDKDFKARGSVRQTAELRIRPGPGGDLRVDLHSRLPLSPGRYEIRVAAESGGTAGSIFTDVEVPDFTKPTVGLSGLVLGRAASGAANASRALSDLIPIAATTRREFERSEPVMAFLRVYQGGRDPLKPVALATRIVDSASRTVFEDTLTLSADDFRTERAADYRFDLSRARLAAGHYLLTIEAKGDKRTLNRSVRFSVK